MHKMLVFSMSWEMIESNAIVLFCHYSLIFVDRQAWISLRDMSKEKAMEEYVKLLLDRSSLFRTFLENQSNPIDQEDRFR